MGPLTGLRVLVTRPKPQGLALCDHIQKAGGQPIYFPTIDIVPPNDPVLFAQQLDTLDQYDWVIFVSQHAVASSLPLIQQYWAAFPSNTKIAAVGAATAKALQAAGFFVTVFPVEDWSSEGLLQLSAFQHVTGKHIALVQGQGGRPLLPETLSARGALVTPMIAYRRGVPDYHDMPHYLDLLSRQAIDVVVSTSGEALQNLMTLFGSAASASLRVLPLIVVSERLVQLAESLNFNKIWLAKNASHDAIMEILQQKKDDLCQSQKR